MNTFFKVTATTLTAVLLMAQAQAQTANGARTQKARSELQKRFDAADTNKDGKLTREEAKAGMPMVSKNFDAIDTGHGGTITLAAIEAFAVSKKGSRKAAAP